MLAMSSHQLILRRQPYVSLRSRETSSTIRSPAGALSNSTLPMSCGPQNGMPCYFGQVSQREAGLSFSNLSTAYHGALMLTVPASVVYTF